MQGSRKALNRKCHPFGIRIMEPGSTQYTTETLQTANPLGLRAQAESLPFGGEQQATQLAWQMACMLFYYLIS